MDSRLKLTLLVSRNVSALAALALLSSCATTHIDFEKTDEAVFERQNLKPQRGVNVYSEDKMPALNFQEFAVLRGRRDEDASNEAVRSHILMVASSYRCDGVIYRRQVGRSLEATCIAFTQHCEQNLSMKPLGTPFYPCDRIRNNK